MAVDALITCYGELAVGGRIYRFGNQEPERHSVTADDVDESRFDIPASSTVLLWSNAVDLPATFALLVIETTAAVMLEFVTNEADTVGEAAYTLELVPDVPLMLGSDASFANHTTPFGGTLDTIDTIRCKNLGGTAAKVHVLIVE